MKIEKIKLYGEICTSGENSAAEFGKRLSEVEAKADVIHLHIHSPGGSCIDGNMIYNQVKQCSKPVDVYIDGMAASMASIVMMAGRKIYMAANAFVMIHAPSTWVGGNAEDFEKTAKLLRSLEDLFLDVYAAKTGRDKEELKEWMQGDNWFNAKEAETEGLIDGIVEASGVKMLAVSDELKKMPIAAIYEQCKASINNKQKQVKAMDKEKLIAKFGLTGVSAASTDEEIQAAIQAKIDAPTAELKKERDSRVAAVIDAAIEAKKITDKQRATYEAIAESNGVEVLEEVLGQMNAPTSITGALNNTGKSVVGREGWDWEKYQAEDPKALEAMAKNDPEMFNELYKAHYNK